MNKDNLLTEEPKLRDLHNTHMCTKTYIKKKLHEMRMNKKTLHEMRMNKDNLLAEEPTLPTELTLNHQRDLYIIQYNMRMNTHIHAYIKKCWHLCVRINVTCW